MKTKLKPIFPVIMMLSGFAGTTQAATVFTPSGGGGAAENFITWDVTGPFGSGVLTATFDRNFGTNTLNAIGGGSEALFAWRERSAPAQWSWSYVANNAGGVITVGTPTTFYSSIHQDTPLALVNPSVVISNGGNTVLASDDVTPVPVGPFAANTFFHQDNLSGDIFFTGLQDTIFTGNNPSPIDYIATTRVTFQIAPEPSGALLTSLGIMGLVLRRRRS